MFPFTFRLPIPGLSNPSTIPPETSSSRVHIATSSAVNNTPDIPHRPQPSLKRGPSPCSTLSPTPTNSRKRGWEPSFAEPSHTATTLASSTGYLDTPAKYRELAGDVSDDYHEIEMMAASVSELPPPAKRRRGLAGSIVSTAMSAALIGTAVGLTVYRLWRDRGKEPESSQPPPPYQEDGWTPNEPAAADTKINVIPPTPRARKSGSQHAASSLGRRSAGHRRRHRAQGHPALNSSFNPVFPPVSSEFNFANSSGEQDNDTTVIEDQMDWIGSKLSVLIEEGKKALGREVVVMSDAQEDEVDDGNDAWEDDAPSLVANRAQTTSPSPKKRRTNLSLRPQAFSASPHFSPSTSPRTDIFQSSVLSAPIPIAPRNQSPVLSSSFKEDPASWQSQELRESMERARAKALQSRGLG